MFDSQIMKEILQINKKILKTLEEINGKESIKNIDLNIENMVVSTGTADTGGTNIIAMNEEMARNIMDTIADCKVKENRSIYGRRD